MPEPDDTPIPHCPHCLREVGERSHFCPACGMPISSHSTIGPMESVWALGWLVSRLLSQPPTVFTVVGVWGLALPSLVILFGASLSLALTAMTGSIGNTLIAVVLDLAAFCYLILAVRVTLSYVRHGPRDRRERESV